MHTIKTTASPMQIATWLHNAAQSSARAANVSKIPAVAAAHKAELTAIERTMLELKDGGSQTDLEEKTKK